MWLKMCHLASDYRHVGLNEKRKDRINKDEIQDSSDLSTKVIDIIARKYFILGDASQAGFYRVVDTNGKTLEIMTLGRYCTLNFQKAC